MNTDHHGLRHSEITERIIGVIFQVYDELGHGFLESGYTEAMTGELRQAGLRIDREVLLAVRFRERVQAMPPITDRTFIAPVPPN